MNHIQTFTAQVLAQTLGLRNATGKYSKWWVNPSPPIRRSWYSDTLRIPEGVSLVWSNLDFILPASHDSSNFTKFIQRNLLGINTVSGTFSSMENVPKLHERKGAVVNYLAPASGQTGISSSVSLRYRTHKHLRGNSEKHPENRQAYSPSQVHTWQQYRKAMFRLQESSAEPSQGTHAPPSVF